MKTTLMNRRCVPLRADHNLWSPDSHTQLGLRLRPSVPMRLEVVASSLENLRDSPNSESAVRNKQRKCPPVTSLPRRLRFEDETETEAECRYLERLRQRRGTRQRGNSVLVSKPDLNLYLKGSTEAGPQGEGLVCEGHQKEWLYRAQVDQFGSCKTVLGGGVNLNLCLYPPVPEEQGRRLYRPHLKLRTEPIRETYIGSVTDSEPCRPRDKAGHGTQNQVRRGADLAEVNGNHVTISQATPTTDLPMNPYSLSQLTTPAQPLGLPAFTCHATSSSPPMPSEMMSQSIKFSSTKYRKNPHLNIYQNQNQEKSQNQDREEQRKLTEPHSELCLGAELKERSRYKEVSRESSESLSSAERSSSETTAESQAPPTSRSSLEEKFKQPIRAEPLDNDTSLPAHSINRDEPARLSLRRLFASVGLERTRASSLDHLNSTCSSEPLTSYPETSSASFRKSSSLPKTYPSLHSISVGAPFSPLRKSSSVQSLRSAQKKKKDRSFDYRPAADQCAQRCFSIEDVASPSSVRSVGRVLEVCSDGTFLLELSRPEDQMFGFIISRGRGRPDPGVYVEDMVDSNTVKLYSGLLKVGDQILEVNRQKVTCLSLDQVTQLLTQQTTITIRVLHQHQETTYKAAASLFLH